MYDNNESNTTIKEYYLDIDSTLEEFFNNQDIYNDIAYNIDDSDQDVNYHYERYTDDSNTNHFRFYSKDYCDLSRYYYTDDEFVSESYVFIDDQQQYYVQKVITKDDMRIVDNVEIHPQAWQTAGYTSSLYGPTYFFQNDSVDRGKKQFGYNGSKYYNSNVYLTYSSEQTWTNYYNCLINAQSKIVTAGIALGASIVGAILNIFKDALIRKLSGENSKVTISKLVIALGAILTVTITTVTNAFNSIWTGYSNYSNAKKYYNSLTILTNTRRI